MSPARAWILCTLLFLATALSFLDRQVLSVLAPQLMAEFTMTNAVYSRVVFAFVLSYTVMFSLGGRLMDRLGTRLGLLLSVAVWTAASAAHAFATGPWSPRRGPSLPGCGRGRLLPPAATKGAVEWMPPEKRALAVGFANGGSAFGAVLAPPLTAWWAGVFGWRGAFVATAILGAAWLIVATGLPRSTGLRLAGRCRRPGCELPVSAGEALSAAPADRAGLSSIPCSTFTCSGFRNTSRAGSGVLFAGRDWRAHVDPVLRSRHHQHCCRPGLR